MEKEKQKICFVAGAGFIGYDMYKEYREALAFQPLMVDMMIVVGIGMAICVGLFFYACIKQKQ